MTEQTSSLKTSATDDEAGDAAATAKHLSFAVISDAAPSRNGVGTFYVDLLEHLEDQVSQVELISPTVENGKWKAGLAFPLPGDTTQKLCMPNPFRMLGQLRRLKPDLIIIATPGVYGIVGTFLARLLKIPVLVGFHTSFEELTELYWENSAKGKIILGYFKVSNHYLFKNCSAVLANSPPMIAQAKQLGAPAVKEIPTLISPVFTKHPTLPSAGDCKRVLFAGRLAPEKNLDSIIEAARNIPELTFSIAGDGPEREKIEKQTKELANLNYLGWLERAALRDTIDQHDILVLPSFFESFGTIALEAMARKRLVIVSTGCGIATLKEFEPGFYTMQNQDLTSCLLSIVAADKDNRIEKAKSAHELTNQLNYKNVQHWCELLVDASKGELR